MEIPRTNWIIFMLMNQKNITRPSHRRKSIIYLTWGKWSWLKIQWPLLSMFFVGIYEQLLPKNVWRETGVVWASPLKIWNKINSVQEKASLRVPMLINFWKPQNSSVNFRYDKHISIQQVRMKEVSNGHYWTINFKFPFVFWNPCWSIIVSKFRSNEAAIMYRTTFFPTNRNNCCSWSQNILLTRENPQGIIIVLIH